MNIIATVTDIREYEIDFIKRLNNSMVSKFRINCGKFQDSKRIMKDVDIIKELSSANVIVMDIPFPGEKMRINIDNHETLTVQKGEIRELVQNTKGSNAAHICVNRIANNIQVGDRLLVNLGEGEFKVVDIDQMGKIYIMAQNTFSTSHNKAIVGSRIMHSDNDFMNDIECVKPETVAFSFVENIKDIYSQIEILRGMKIQIIAKIENMNGVKRIDEILEYVDGIMIARGDLELNVDIKEFVEIQKKIAEKTHKKRKKCIVATGIGDSLQKGRIPSRADLSDFYLIKSLEPDEIVLTRPLVMRENVEEIIYKIRCLLE